jgi:hypothetical protein
MNVGSNMTIHFARAFLDGGNGKIKLLQLDDRRLPDPLSALLLGGVR